MTAPGEIIQLQVGDTVPVGSVLANIIIMGIVTDVNNPNMFGATLQAYQSQAVLTVPVLQGVPGIPGQPTFALRFQNDTLSSPSQLPNTLTNLASDLGKYWVFAVTDQNNNVIATDMYVWYGTTIGFKPFPIGSPGPPGATPLITPNVVLTVPGNGQGPNGADSWIAVTGTVSNPVYTFYLAAPQGVPGPAGQIGTSPDVDFTTTPPAPGNLLVCSSRVIPGSPVGLTINPSSTGGTLGANNWFYVVTAIVPNGESLQSNEVEVTTSGSTNQNVLNWTAPGGGGATGYKVYRGNGALNISTLIGTINSVNTTTFTDNGITGTPGSPPSVGVVAGRSIWVPQTPVSMLPQLYTVPSSSFTALNNVGGSRQTICTFALPQQNFPWKPYVHGSLKVFGFNLSFTPLLIDCEVLLANATTGTLVAKGEGNTLGSVTISPYTSTSGNTSQAMTPTNSIGLVPANHTGTQGTIYATLVNQGMAGTYSFATGGAQLSVLVVPTPNAA